MANYRSGRGSRHRSFSDSETDIPVPTPIPTPRRHLQQTLVRADSQNVISSARSSIIDDFAESPLGSGLGTRLQSRQSIVNSNSNLLRNEYDNLLESIIQWESSLTTTIDLVELSRKTEEFKVLANSLARKALTCKSFGISNYNALIGVPKRLNRLKINVERRIARQSITELNREPECQGDISNTPPSSANVSTHLTRPHPQPSPRLITSDSIPSPPSSSEDTSVPEVVRNIQMLRSYNLEGFLPTDQFSEWKRSVMSKLENMEKSQLEVKKSVEKSNRSYLDLEHHVGELATKSTANSIRIGCLETRVQKLEYKIDEIKNDCESKKTCLDRKINDIHQIIPGTNVGVRSQPSLGNAVSEGYISSLSKELDVLKEEVFCSRAIIDDLRDLVLEINVSPEQPMDVNHVPPHTATPPHPPNLTTPVPRPTTLSPTSRRNNFAAAPTDMFECELVQKELHRTVSRLLEFINFGLNEDCVDIALLKKCNAADPKIRQDYVDCSKSLREYGKLAGADREYCNYVATVLDRTCEFRTLVERLSNQQDISLIKDNTKFDATDIGVFSDNSDKSIYEFLRDFDSAYSGWGSKRQVANKLFSKHISNEIKEKLFMMSDNLDAMREWLTLNYGKASSIVNDVIKALKRKKRPDPNNRKDRYVFFADILFSLTKLEKLTMEPNIGKFELENCLFSQSTLSILISILPQSEADEFVRQMSIKGLDWKNPMGYETFVMFRAICGMERDAMEASKHLDASSSRKSNSTKVNHINANAISSSDSEDEYRAHGVSSTPGQTSKSSRQWYTPGLKFPCPLNGHGTHLISSCIEFLTMKPRERRALIHRNVICYSCLRPKNVCKEKRCNFGASIPPELLCPGCEIHAKPQGWVPLNVLMCQRREHNTGHPTKEELKAGLEKLIGKLDTSIQASSIKYSVNHVQQSINHTSELIDGLCEEVSMINSTPTIDTCTGLRVPTCENTVIPEVKEHSFYLMQIIRIGDADCLVFFDRGANAHLIKGSIAESESLLRTSSKPTAITVVGGGRIKTEYGSYKFNLGPDSSGEFHELSCIGMDSVTSSFNKYDLSSIITEYQKYVPAEDQSEVLPMYTGGSDVKLLLGIKNTKLDPILLHTLPSGISVYQSPFKDIWGSRIMFAGPHKSFTNTNNDCEVNNIQSVSFMNDFRWSDEWDGHECNDVYYSIAAVKSLGLTVNPSPLTKNDFRDAGCDVPGDFEELIDQSSTPVYSTGTGLEAHYCGVHKAVIPIARMRELVDQDDIGNSITYRCSECSKCMTCKRSKRNTAVSIQESREQTIIENSVIIDKNVRKVFVTLPFLKDPVESLMLKHRGNNNYSQASKVYYSQCRLSDAAKVGMRKVHSELVNNGFMKRLSEFSCVEKDRIKNAPFNHYHPWRIVYKESQSTPVRMVVDPTMTGLNLLLAKGENKLGNICDILIRNRSYQYSWSSDIKKLYNQLHLVDSALPFSLFLYHDSLDSSVSPEVWVMTRAWYGVVPTGAQAGHAIEMLAVDGVEDFPDAVDAVCSDKYVDDIASGAENVEQREKQIRDVKLLLEQGGFDLKYIVKSGEKPCEAASSDGSSIKLLGYKWDVEQDTLSPGFSELNFNKKIRGARKPNETPIITKDDVVQLLDSVVFTRRIVVGKVAEHFDPLGWFEAVKLQMKLELSKLNGFSWDEVLPEEQQSLWRDLLLKYSDYSEIKIPRCCIPGDEVSCSPVRLICLSDAAEHAAGAVVYAGRKLCDGSWSCALVSAKSKLVSETIPRNELSAILLMTELAFIVKKSLGERVQEVVYVTDSTIALSWCHNVNKKLRMFTFSRVETIRQMISWTTNQEDLPLYHVDSELNVADLLTKKHDIPSADVSAGSVWQTGLSWMRLDLSDMPLMKYNELVINKQEVELVKAECFEAPVPQFTSDSKSEPEISIIETVPSVFFSAAGRVARDLIVDPVYFGWRKANRIITILKSWKKIVEHRKHTVPDKNREECYFCGTRSELWDVRHSSSESELYFFKRETDVIKKTMNKDQLKKYFEQGSILYHCGRLSSEASFQVKDMDNIPVLDMHEFTGNLPVVLVDSPVLYSFLMLVHLEIAPHAGVETTVKEVFKKMLVPEGLRRLVRRIKNDCVKCRMLKKKTMELEMSQHPQARTIIAPPFYSVMMDIAYGFVGQTYKRSRTKMKVYALVIVCICTGATNILALEGIESQDVIQALERHAAVHGVPADLYVDNGTQLKALEHSSFSIRDVHSHVFDKLNLRVHVSSPKSHEERGRVERKIGLIRNLLERLGVQQNAPMTVLQWETVFQKISNMLDDMPLAKGNSSSVSFTGFDILTANRVKLGRNNYRSLEGAGIKLELSGDLTRILARNREVYAYWYQLFIDNIHLLTLRPNKWVQSDNPPKSGDVVLFVHNDSGYSKQSISWRLGKVVDVMARKVMIQYVVGMSKKSPVSLGTVERSFREISILFSVEELSLNSRNHCDAVALHSCLCEI